MSSTLPLDAPSPLIAGAFAHARRRALRGLALAAVLSVGVHLAFTLWPVTFVEDDELPPLQVTITELPPPPAVSAKVVAKPRVVRKPRPRPAPPPPTPVEPEVVAEASPAEPPLPVEYASVEAPAAAEPAPAPEPPLEIPGLSEAETDLPPPYPDTPTKTLPPRVDLAYRVFYGTRGFYIGEATYRFEHTGNRYRIATVGEPRGLAALIIRGEGKVESSGFITPTGLQPETFSVERGPGRKRETADFDWETGVVSLDDDKSAALDIPTYDPLSMLWQFYFMPPATDQETFAIATTKRLNRYLFKREGHDTLTLASGPVETERWRRQSDDGKIDALVWLAPSLHYIAVKLRYANTDRGTVEAELDAIRIDDTPR